MIKVSACVIHEVLKEVKSEKNGTKKNETTLDLSSSLLDSTDQFVQKLLEKIHNSFSVHSSLKNTHFVPDHDNMFSTSLKSYLEAGTEADFLRFSFESIKDLELLIKKENFATGGYYIFSDHSYEGLRYLSVMVVRKNTEALNLEKVKGRHQPGPTENINTDKIAMGFRLNHDNYVTPALEKNYISLLTNQPGRELSGYFKNWVNAAGVISGDKNSGAFVSIIKQINLPRDEEGNTTFTREEFQKAAHQFAEKSPNKLVNVNTFSAFAYGEANSDYIVRYALQQGITLDPEFKRSAGVFKKLVTIRAMVPGIELNIDYNKLNSNEVDVQDEIIIIKSAELVKQIKEQQ